MGGYISKEQVKTNKNCKSTNQEETQEEIKKETQRNNIYRVYRVGRNRFMVLPPR
jgi:hypothetical protein